MLADLRWLGLHWDEGPDTDGKVRSEPCTVLAELRYKMEVSGFETLATLNIYLIYEHLLSELEYAPTCIHMLRFLSHEEKAKRCAIIANS